MKTQKLCYQEVEHSDCDACGYGLSTIAQELTVQEVAIAQL
ncbi:hypothetical protein [Nostoc sp.]